MPVLTNQHAERYPGRVRAMVLESVDDHSAPTTGAFLATQAGHGAYSLSDCAQRTVDNYLVSLAVPARGFHCGEV